MKHDKPPVPRRGAPGWMVTYADMITLMMAFFVLLFAFSSVDAGKWRTLVATFSGAPGLLNGTQEVVPGQTMPPLSAPEQDSPLVQGDLVQEADEWDKVVREMMMYVRDNRLADDMSVGSDELEIVVRLRGDIVFDSGKADLKSEAEALIADFFKKQVLPDLRYFSTIRIEGHTDNVPIRNSEFADNVQLSQRRSWAVWNFIVNTYPAADTAFAPIDQSLIDCNGRGEHHPVASNDTPEGRARNRRVDFVLVRRLPEEVKQLVEQARRLTGLDG